MAIKHDASVPFDLDVVGESTESTFKGAFRAKVRLSFREQLRMDQIRRELLGPDPAGNASPDAAAFAIALAELSVRIVEAPEWWKEAKGGLDLEDENVLLEVWEKVKAILKEEADKKAEAAKAAEEELREFRREADAQEQKTVQAAKTSKRPRAALGE